MSAFQSISITSKFMAYLRQFTDIPFAKDVAEGIHAAQAVKGFLQEHDLTLEDINWYGPLFEIRYKSIWNLIKESKVHQVLELASGVSLRGLAMTRDPQMRYVESDLEELTLEKTPLVPAIYTKNQLVNHGNLKLAAVNALEMGQLQKAVEHFDLQQPMAVVNEGLLQYLSAEELEKVSRNIAELLKRSGGVWITPDFAVKKDAGPASEKQARVRQAILSMTDRRLSENAFESEEKLEAFFQRMGFSAQVLNQVDVISQVTCLKPLNLTPELVDQLKPRLKIWVLSSL
jgi:O-methyltransferase involved in polyketide biosynthesis